MNLSLFVLCSFMSSSLRTTFCPSTPTPLFSADNQVLFGALLGSLLQSYRDSLFTVVLTLSPWLKSSSVFVNNDNESYWAVLSSETETKFFEICDYGHFFWQTFLFLKYTWAIPFSIAYTSAPNSATLYTASKPFPIDPVGFMTMFGFALTELLSPVTDCDWCFFSVWVDGKMTYAITKQNNKSKKRVTVW